jgi:hypothetical protein
MAFVDREVTVDWKIGDALDTNPRGWGHLISTQSIFVLGPIPSMPATAN